MCQRHVGQVAPAVRMAIAPITSLCVVASVYGTYHALPGPFESANDLGLAIGQLVDLP